MDRPNATGQTLAIPRGQQDPQRFFNTGAVALQPFGTFGNLGRNVLIGPGIINLDSSVMKSIPVLEAEGWSFALSLSTRPTTPTGEPLM